MAEVEKDPSTEPKRTSSKIGIISVLVSIWFIINGSMRLNQHPSGTYLHTWGLILVIVGTVGVIWKGWELVRK
jgi:hypothetical protein